MRDSMVSRETWTYECLGCLHEWQAEFEVWHCSDGHGGAVVVYRRDGHRCVSPWAEPTCPSCGGYDVKILPAGPVHRRPAPREHHPELEMLFRLRRLHAY